MADSKPRTPAKTLAENCDVRIPSESTEYRSARTALLAEVFELRPSSSASPNCGARCRRAAR